MKTAEVLDQTETFEIAGFDILNHVGKITQVDMPMEYGRVCLAEQVGKHAALFLNIINLRLDITHLYYPAKNSFQKSRLKRREIFTELLLYTLTT